MVVKIIVRWRYKPTCQGGCTIYTWFSYWKSHVFPVDFQLPRLIPGGCTTPIQSLESSISQNSMGMFSSFTSFTTKNSRKENSTDSPFTKIPLTNTFQRFFVLLHLKTRNDTKRSRAAPSDEFRRVAKAGKPPSGLDHPRGGAFPGCPGGAGGAVRERSRIDGRSWLKMDLRSNIQ